MTFNTLFSLNLPEGWKETTTFTYEGPNDSGLTHNLVIVVTPKDSNEFEIKSYVKSIVETNLQYMSGFELLSEQEASVNGMPAYQICYKYVPAEEQILFQKQLFIEAKKSILLCVSTYNKKTLQTISNEVDSIITSLRLIDSDKLMKYVDQFA